MNKTILYKIYEFSSAHRLNSDKLSVTKNWDIYDKCNNLNGHGHDYSLEVGITGKIAPDTGMLIGLEDLDNKVYSILNQLDYKHLNNEVPYFKDATLCGVFSRPWRLGSSPMSLSISVTANSILSIECSD